MSRPTRDHGPSYDPVPNSQSTPDLSFGNSELDLGLASPSHTPVPDDTHMDSDPAVPRPRFLGRIDGEGSSYRDSYYSAQDSRQPSEYGSSIYALNPNIPSSPRESPVPGGSYRDDPQATPRASRYADEEPGMPMGNVTGSRYLTEKRSAYVPSSPLKSKRNLIILGALIGVVIIAIVIAVPVAINAKKKSASENDIASGNGNGTSGTGSDSGGKSSGKTTVVTGGDGTTVTMDDGSTFTYLNPFGGTWYWDEDDPFNNAAQANSWTPPLNQSFNFGVDRIRGVNLGGWLVTEPFIVPALYQKYGSGSPIAIDEWTLSERMTADTSSGGGLSQMEDHYNTFITEQDFAQIAGAGLNFVRIPIGYWAIETRDGEPFLAKTSWTYFLKAVKWARKYGIRINLDFHALPGSQNGWNHSGRLGTISVLNGTMGMANVQRSLDYIRIFTEFISQSQYKDVVVMFGVTNEPQASVVGNDILADYYFEAYQTVRKVSGTGAGNGPMVSYHDGFAGLPQWAGFLPGADRIALDYHPYICFGGQISGTINAQVNAPCTTWGSQMNTSMENFGMTGAGEWSNAINDCGLYVNGVNLGNRYDGTYQDGNTWPVIGSCDPWVDWANWDQTMKDGVMAFSMSSMDALQNWFFWTWKIGNSTSGTVEAPSWSYSLGLQEGWVPTDPRQAVGSCNNTAPWTGTLSAAANGGSGTIPASATATLNWPPASLSNAGGAATALPTYTPTGTIVTLPPPTFTASNGSTIDAGSGWFNSADTTSMMVPIASCSYLSPWVESAVAAPPACTAGKRDVPEPTITAAPSL